jgi:hypothetical protein
VRSIEKCTGRREDRVFIVENLFESQKTKFLKIKKK